MLAASRFPDVQRLLIDALVGLAGGDEHTGIETPVDLADRLPFVRCRRIGGPSDRLNDFPRIEIDVFAATYSAAENLAETIRQWLCGPPPPLPALDHAECDIGPRELPWGDGSSIRRWSAEYQITARRRVVS